jgi:hypothetical protein
MVQITINWGLYKKQIRLLRDAVSVESDLIEMADGVDESGRYTDAYKEAADLVDDLRELHKKTRKKNA